MRRLSISADEQVTVTQEDSAVSETLRGVCQGAKGRAAVGDNGALQVDVGAGWKSVKLTTSADLHAVVCGEQELVAVGASGVTVRVDWSTLTATVSNAGQGAA